MWATIEATRTYTYRVLEMCGDLEAGRPGASASEVHAHSAAAILRAADVNMRVAEEALQIHGGSGYMWEMEVNRLYRAAKLLEIGAGTQEIRRNIIAKELLRP